MMFTKNDISTTIIAMEQAALERWGKGDPDGFLEISDPEVVYFDPFQKCRLNGLDALTQLYDSLRGKIKIDHFELINPKVQICENAAVLTFNYISQMGETINRWNCTEVYRHTPSGWRIIQTHWSMTLPILEQNP